MRVSEFDYEFPNELIAQEPVTPRDAARLMVMERGTGRLVHAVFRDLGSFLRPGDCLVLNDTRVLPARFYGVRLTTSGSWEGLFLREHEGLWELMTKTKGKPQPGEHIHLVEADVTLELVSKTADGTWWVCPTRPVSFHEMLARAGHVPLPPYIRGGVDVPGDREHYQTVYAAKEGAVAAPTAGLHFTDELMASLAAMGVAFVKVTLHVGPGTFQPVKVEETADHPMHAEWCEVSPEAAACLAGVRRRHGRILAVGTTVVRTLESAFHACGGFAPYQGWTRLFIVPPYTFRAVDGLITNFHLPKSTLLMLVAAFAGLEPTLAAYREAIRQRYRFFSYGDTMLIVDDVPPPDGL